MTTPAPIPPVAPMPKRLSLRFTLLLAAVGIPLITWFVVALSGAGVWSTLGFVTVIWVVAEIWKWRQYRRNRAAANATLDTAVNIARRMHEK